MSSLQSKQVPIYKKNPQPKGTISAFFWRRWILFESTFVLSMLEPWEKLMLMSILTILLILVPLGLFRYLPQHVMIMQRRAAYYLWGQGRAVVSA